MLLNKYDAVSLTDDEKLNYELRRAGKQETKENRGLLRVFATIIEVTEGQDFVTDEQLHKYIDEHGSALK